MRRSSVALVVLFLIAFAGLASSATAHHKRAKDTASFFTKLSSAGPLDRQISHGLRVGPDDGGGKSHLDQHGPTTGHLPGSSENVDVVGKVRLTHFEGDISVVSNEWCAEDRLARNMPGGFTLYDITNPRRPTVLRRQFGDFDNYGNRANQSHSAIAWNAGDEAYVAAIDNEELEDVDI